LRLRGANARGRRRFPGQVRGHLTGVEVNAGAVSGSR
jgi:hypothetical protein